jgi:hypothetical protein
VHDFWRGCRGLLALTALALAACEVGRGGEITGDVAFVGDAGDGGGGSGDASEPVAGCDLLATEPCGSGETSCCAAGQRCVPAADGSNVCGEIGDRERGDACGQAGFDNCAIGLLCAAPEPGAALECRQLCAPGATTCGTGSRCVNDGTLALESVGLCSP